MAGGPSHRPGSSAAPARRSAGGAGLPADTGACRLLTTPIAAVVLAPQALGRSTDDANVCAFTAADGTTLVDVGDLPLGRGQSASSVLAGELSDRNRSGYRTSRVTVSGVAAVLEDGRPHVAQVVWVQRGRVLTLTVSPAGSSSTSRVLHAAAAISLRFR